MLRSLYSGISGMRANQTKLDVTGNNIANVGTTAFKSSRVRFQDMLSQSAGEATAPGTNQGGINGSQIGLGVQVAGIDTITKQGMMQPTSRKLDMAIDLEGYFIVGKGETIFGDGLLPVNQSIGTHNVDPNALSRSKMDLMYTRDGSFTLDYDGNLLTSDGYRVMGYPLTNDTTVNAATTQSPNSVSVAGLTFRFGPGAALNGYHLELGAVGEGTTPSASVDKASKKIVLNGDFSAPGALKADQMQDAVNNALSSSGIAQHVFVAGNPTVIRNLTSPAVKGGSDDKAPSSVSAAGLTFEFSEGMALNGFSIELGDVSEGKDTTASVDIDKRKIILNGDFVTPNAVSANAVRNAVNQALSNANIAQVVTKVGGSAMNIGTVSGIADNKGSIPAPASINAVPTADGGPGTTTLGGFKLTFSDGGQLNGYKIKLGTTVAGTSPAVQIDKANKTITISGDFTVTDPGAISDLGSKIMTKFNTQLASYDITQPKMTAMAPAGTTLSTNDNAITIGKVNYPVTGAVGKDGSDLASPSSVIIGGLEFGFNKGTTFNGYTVQLGKISVGTPLDVQVANNKIVISGDFITPNAFTTADLQNLIDTKVNAAVAAGKINNATASPAGAVKVTVTGAAKSINGVTSRAIDGGTKLESSDPITVAGLNFQFAPGAALNDYEILVGNIGEGTPTSATIDTTKRKIVINGDFTSAKGVTAGALQSAINNVLEANGFNQSISVSGVPVVINDNKSNNANGGTPVQSINANGVISFVDGTKQVNAYDGNLKSLRIPDKIRDDATGNDVKVTDISVGKDGVVNAVLEDGRVSAIGQLAMASFKNPAGLTKLGKNLYHGSVNSGEATLKSGIGTMGHDNSKGYGEVLQSMLEMSNVDLAEQFTDMIITSRAFQASSKVITTGDEILQDILNLKR